MKEGCMRQTEKNKLSHIISIPTVIDEAKLCFGEAERHIPFEIKRFYFIFDIDDNAVRGKHAHKTLQQVLFCLHGKVSITLDNGKEKERIALADPSKGVLLDRMVWHEMLDLKNDTVLLVIASDYFNEADYIRNYSEFLELVRKRDLKNNGKQAPNIERVLYKLA
jgi:dTDP-4-dehydrorhamnose 3,5-epimerase-like enzyme